MRRFIPVSSFSISTTVQIKIDIRSPESAGEYFRLPFSFYYERLLHVLNSEYEEIDPEGLALVERRVLSESRNSWRQKNPKFAMDILDSEEREFLLNYLKMLYLVADIPMKFILELEIARRAPLSFLGLDENWFRSYFEHVLKIAHAIVDCLEYQLDQADIARPKIPMVGTAVINPVAGQIETNGGVGLLIHHVGVEPISDQVNLMTPVGLIPIFYPGGLAGGISLNDEILVELRKRFDLTRLVNLSPNSKYDPKDDMLFGIGKDHAGSNLPSTRQIPGSALLTVEEAGAYWAIYKPKNWNLPKP